MQLKSRQKSAGAASPGIILAAVLALVAAAAGLVSVAKGDAGAVPVLVAADLSAWQPWKFSGETRYTPVEVEGRRAVRAVSEASASGYYRKITIDLKQTPVLRWSWRVDDTLGTADETSKAGDDSPARVYVLATHPIFFWKTRALAYVWSSAQPKESDWPSAYTGNQRVIAVRTGKRELGKWRREQRNVRRDFQRYFGKEVRYVDAVAFMTDTDNTGLRAVAYYGDIYFEEE